MLILSSKLVMKKIDVAIADDNNRQISDSIVNKWCCIVYENIHMLLACVSECQISHFVGSVINNTNNYCCVCILLDIIVSFNSMSFSRILLQTSLFAIPKHLFCKPMTHLLKLTTFWQIARL